MSADPEMLVGMSVEELEALADTLLAPSAQERLEDLLARQKDKQLTATDEQELDNLLRKVDQLTILKTRARYTLNHEKTAARS
jgi:uncharacterized protein YpiB (UPF0302 family)